MYRFSSDMNFNQVEDSDLTQVAFGPYDLILRFSAGLEAGKTDCSLSIQCRISTTTDGQVWTDSENYKDHALTLLNCLADTCTYAVVDERTLRLSFKAGAQVLLHDDSDQYESVVISYGGQTIVI